MNATSSADNTNVRLRKLPKSEITNSQPIQSQHRLELNYKARSELRKKISKRHLLRHYKDTDNKMTCHRFRRKLLSHAYLRSIEILTRSKLYAVLYLGLLLVKDKIQLGDMLRFIREGHLSYNSVTHFFPRSVDASNFNLHKWNQSGQFTHASLRQMAAKLANLLEISAFITVPNVAELSQRYCHELNLPGKMELPYI